MKDLVCISAASMTFAVSTALVYVSHQIINDDESNRELTRTQTGHVGLRQKIPQKSQCVARLRRTASNSATLSPAV